MPDGSDLSCLSSSSTARRTISPPGSVAAASARADAACIQGRSAWGAIGRRRGELLLCFSFPDQRSGLHRPAVRRRIIIDAPENKVDVARPHRLQHRHSWSSHHRRCHRLFRHWRHPLPVLVKLALDPSPRLLPFSRGHRRRCC